MFLRNRIFGDFPRTFWKQKEFWERCLGDFELYSAEKLIFKARGKLRQKGRFHFLDRTRFYRTIGFLVISKGF